MANRNAELEDAIADPSPYLVYADWLTAAGDPRGELIVVQHRLSKDRDAKTSEREKELLAADLFGEPLDPELATLTWHWGFVRGVRLFNFRDWMDSSFEVLPLVNQIFTSPVSMLATELRLGVLRWMENGQDVPAVLNRVAELGAAARLELLVLGDVHDIDCDLAHHPLGDLSGLSTDYSGLRSLTIHGCDFSLGEAIDLPQLRDLSIETCGLSVKDVTAIGAAPWPALETLTLWFGSQDYGSDTAAGDLAPLLSGRQTPKLRNLGLANCEFAADLCAALPSAAVLPQLRTLDLSLGTLNDADIAPLLENAAAFGHLESLDVSENFLSEDGIASLASLGPTIVADDQKELEEGEEDWRYVSHGE